MTLITRYTLILITLFASSIGTMWLSAHAQPFPVTALFTNPDMSPCARPCLFGIQPGQTSFADAIVLLHAHPFTRGLIPNLEGDVFGDETLSVVLNRDSTSVISTIQIAVRARPPSHWETVSPDQVISVLNALSLGQVVEALGTPTLVTDDLPLTQSYYTLDRLIFTHRQTQPGQLGAGDALESLTMYATLPDPPAHGHWWPGFDSSAH